MAKRSAGGGGFKGNSSIDLHVNVSGTGEIAEMSRAVKTLGAALSSITSGNDIQNYWRSQDEALQGVVKAFNDFNSVANQTNAGDLVKNFNSFIALGGDVNAVIGKVGNAFTDTISRAKDLAPAIDAAFNPNFLREFFNAFEELELKGADIAGLFKNISLNDDELGASKEKIAELSNELANVSSSLRDANEEIEALERRLDGLDYDSFRRISNELTNLKYKMEDEFEAFLQSNNIPKLDFIDYFQGIRNGAFTANEAIIDFKSNYGYLLEQNPGLDSTQLTIFTEQIKQMRNDLSALRDDLSNLGTNTAFSNGTQGINAETAAINEQREAIQGMSRERESLQFIIDLMGELVNKGGQASDGANNIASSIAQIVQATQGLASGSIDGLKQTAEVLKSIGSLDGINVSEGSISRVVEALNKLSELNGGSLSTVSTIDFRGFNGLKVSGATLKNLAEYLPSISKIKVDGLRELSKLDFSGLKVNKATVTNLASLAKLSEEIERIKRKVETIAPVNKSVVSSTNEVAKAQQVATSMVQNYTANIATMVEQTDNVSTVNGELARITRVYTDNAETASNVTSVYKDKVNGLTETIKESYDQTGGLESATRSITKEFKTSAQAAAEAEKEQRKLEKASVDAARVEKKIAEEKAKADRLLSKLPATANDEGTKKLIGDIETYKSLVDDLSATYQNNGIGSFNEQHLNLETTFIGLKSRVDEYTASVDKANKDTSDLWNVQNRIASMQNGADSLTRMLASITGDEAQGYRDQISGIKTEFSGLENIYNTQGVEAYNAALHDLQQRFAGLTQNVNEYVSTQRLGRQEDAEALKLANTRISALTRYQNTIRQSNKIVKNMASAAYSPDDTIRNAYSKIVEQSDTLKKMQQPATNADISEWNTFRQQVGEANNVIKENTTLLEQNGYSAQTLSDRIGGLGKKFLSWLSVSQAIMFTIRSVKNLVSASIELDDAMTQLKIVTDETEASYQRYAQTISRTAQELGTSITDLINATTTYARLGYSLDESSTLAKFTGMLQETGNIQASDAQDAVTAIIKAFNLDIDDIESVMDKMVIVGNNFPISVSQIAEGMNNASSALAAGGNSFEQSVALLTAANTTIQDAAKASTGLRTITARIRNMKTELDDLGESLSQAKYDEIVQALTKITLADGTTTSVALTDMNGELRNTYDIFMDISKIWDQMSSNDQAALAQTIAGTRQQNIFYSIVEQFKEASGAMDEMSSSAGALTDAYSVYTESTTAHLKSFQAAFKELGSDIFQSDATQSVIDLGTWMLNFLDGGVRLINQLGGLKTVLASIVGLVVTLKSEDIMSRIIYDLPKKIGGLKDSTGSFISDFTKLPAAFSKARAEGISLNEAMYKMGMSFQTCQLVTAGLAIGITAAIAAYSRWKQHLDEVRQASEDNAKASASELEAFEKNARVINSYLGQENLTATQETELQNAISGVSYALDGKTIALKSAKEEQRGYREEIAKTTDELLEQANIDAQQALWDAQNALKSETSSFLGGSTIGVAVKSQEALYGEDQIKAMRIALDIMGDMANMAADSNNLFVGVADVTDPADSNSVLNYYYRLIDAQDALTKEGLMDTAVYDAVHDEVLGLEKSLGNILDLTYQAASLSYKASNGVPQTTEDFNAMTEAVLSSTGATGSYADALRGLITKEYPELASQVKEVQGVLTGGSIDNKTSFASLLGLDSDGEETAFLKEVDGYVEKIEKLNDALEKIKDGKFDSKNFVELVKEFPELANSSDNLSEGINKLKRSLTGYNAVADSSGNITQEASGIMAVFADAFGRVDSRDDVNALQAFMDAVLQLGKVVGSTEFSIDIDAETEGMENLWSAMKESVSSTGVTAKSIASLKERFSELEASGYDVSKMFERTENGVHLNTSALRELEHAYESQKKEKFADHLSGLVERYNELTKEIDKSTDAAEAAGLYSERSGILEDIENTSLLAAQYEGLTSAFYKWEQAQSIGEEGDMYDSLASSLEDIKELYDEGLIGTNKFRTAVQLMSAEDLSTASVDTLIDAYEKGYPKMKRYFTESSDGCLRFLHDVEDLNSEWVHMNKDGSWDINFGVGKDDDVARALGINVESVQNILRKLSDYGFDIKMDAAYASFDLLSSKVERANKELIELGKTEIKFNFSADGDDLLRQIEQAQQLLNEFRDSDGSIDLSVDGAQEAQEVLVTLLRRKQALAEPEIMSIDTTELSGASDDIVHAIDLLKEFTTNANNLEVQASASVTTDTTEAQQKLQNIASDIDALPDEVKTAVGIDDESFASSIEALKNSEINLEAGLTIPEDDIAVVQEAINSIDPKKIEFSTNSDETKKEITEVDSAEIADKDFTITAKDNSTSVIHRITEALAKVKDKNITVTTYYKSFGSAVMSGGSHVNGTAMAHGNWGTSKNGVALGGELGQELLVRDGHFYTIGDTGAEFFGYKKGDIIFNAEQTAQIFKYGKIRSGAKRGSAMYEGTAFSSGSGKITAKGSVKTTPSGSSSSSKSGSSSSGSDSSSDKSEPQVIDWIEIAIDRIERAISNLGEIAGSGFQKLVRRLTSTNDEIVKTNEEISLQRRAYTRYIQQADSVGLSAGLAERVRNGTIDINEYDEDTADLIKKYQEWYEKALDCNDAIIELTESLGELYQSRFDMVLKDYEDRLSSLTHQTNKYDKAMEKIAELGYLATTTLYEAQQDVARNTLKVQTDELDSLINEMYTALGAGSIAKGSEAYNAMEQQINEIREAVQDTETEIIRLGNAIRDVKWERFDYAIDRMSEINSEASFLVDLLSNNELFEENGQLSESGMATMGLYAQNYNVYMALADKYAKEIKELNKEIANDPNNTKLLERRHDLIDAQRDSISAAEDEKEAMIGLVEEGIEKELESLKDLIDAYEESLDSAKDLHDYQRKIEDQTSEIAKLQKQLAAYSNDTSEENRARVQKLKVDLGDAVQSLEDMQYDRYITEQKKMLDNFYDEYSDLLNRRLDDVNALVGDLITMVNASASDISSTITQTADSVGYSLMDGTDSIWNNSDAYSIVAQYGSDMFGEMTAVYDVLTNIETDIRELAIAGNRVGHETVTPNPIQMAHDAVTKIRAMLNGGGKPAFKSGGLADFTGQAWLDGTKENPELVLDAEDTRNFIALKDAMRSVADGTSPLAALFGSNDGRVVDGLASITRPGVNSGNSIGSVSYEINIPIDHVDDYDDFMNKMRNDRKFEAFIKSMTVDRLSGGSRIAKNRYTW